ncbi:hypothetical protein Tco_1425407 [Tanacetum coccineum]
MADQNYHQLLPLIREKRQKKKSRRQTQPRVFPKPITARQCIQKTREEQIPFTAARPRKKGGVFNSWKKGTITSARSDSRRRSPQAKRTEVETRRRQQKRTPSRATSQYSESEDSEGGHWKSKSRRQKSNTYEDDLYQPWNMLRKEILFTPRSGKLISRGLDALHVKTYDGSGDPEDHLKLFQSTRKTKGWAMRHGVTCSTSTSPKASVLV